LVTHTGKSVGDQTHNPITGLRYARPDAAGKAVKTMLSLELIGILGLFFGLIVYGLFATHLERRAVAGLKMKSEPRKEIGPA
jgi:hypothetical protein